MSKVLAFVLLSMASLCGEAKACSIVFPTPDELFEQSHVVALAVPIGVSRKPVEAAQPQFVGTYRETVLWQVLLGWKGSLRSGSTFTTRRMLATEEACTADFPVSNDARVVYAKGAEPFASFYHFSLGPHSHYLFKHLAERGAK